VPEHTVCVFGALLPTPREGEGGIRVTAGRLDGRVLLEAVGHRNWGDADHDIERALSVLRAHGVPSERAYGWSPFPHGLTRS